MHTITVSIQGDVAVVESVEVNDAEALPLFVKLKSVLGAEASAKPVRRRGRPRKLVDENSALTAIPESAVLGE